MTRLPLAPAAVLEHLIRMEARLRDAILGDRGQDHRSGDNDIVREASGGGSYTGDTIYAIDERGEDALYEYCQQWARELDGPLVLVAEGLPGSGRRTYPAGADERDALIECIVDPIDGTRGLMYDKRSAWVLAAVAPGWSVLGRRPTMSDLEVAVQTELPTSRARLADTLWAVRGSGAGGETLDLVTGTRRPLQPAPSRATTLAHGFASISKFFPGTKEAAVWIEERLFAEVVGEHAGGAPLVFDDEYISSGGQLYELLVGHDRFIADLRPAFMAIQGKTKDERRKTNPFPRPHSSSVLRPSSPRRLCARPYDLCTALIAQDAGVLVTDEWGRPLAAPLDTVSDVSWVGYANKALRRQIEPVLQRLLADLGVPRP